MSGTGGANGYGYGPFHRLRSPKTQTTQLAAEQMRSHVLLGKEARGSSLLSVKAYRGPLPTGQHGIEFYTVARPSNAHPHLVFWYGNHKDVWDVNHQSEAYALIVVDVVKADYP